MTRQISVANIIEEAKLGGPQRRIALIARELNKFKTATTVILPTENAFEFKTLLDNCRVRYKLFNISRITREWIPAFKYLLFSPFEIVRIARYFKTEKFDLVHVSGGSWQYKGLIAGRIAGCKVVWHLNDTYTPVIIRFLVRVFQPLADEIVFSSEKTKVYYSHFLRGSKLKGQTILPPVDTKFYSPDMNKNKLLQQKTDKRVVVGTIANINVLKNFEMLIDVAAKIKKDKQIRFVIGGPVSKNQRAYYLKLKSIIQKREISNIEFLGRVEKVAEILNSFDVFVCTSKFESGPMTLFEAMSMGKAVVSTNVGDVARIIQNGINGYVVPVNDIDGFSKRILQFVEDEFLRYRCGREARKTALKKLDVSLAAKRHADTYRRLLKMKL